MEIDTRSPAPAKVQPYTLAGAGPLVPTSVLRSESTGAALGAHLKLQGAQYHRSNL